AGVLGVRVVQALHLEPRRPRGRLPRRRHRTQPRRRSGDAPRIHPPVGGVGAGPPGAGPRGHPPEARPAGQAAVPDQRAGDGRLRVPPRDRLHRRGVPVRAGRDLAHPQGAPEPAGGRLAGLEGDVRPGLPGPGSAALPGPGGGGPGRVRAVRAGDHRRGLRVLQAPRPGQAREAGRRRGARGGRARRAAGRPRPHLGPPGGVRDPRALTGAATVPPAPAIHDGDQVVFVGSGGGRMTTAFQARATGGVWVLLDGVRVCVDPGPGALVHARARTLNLDPSALDAVVLTHKHLDHSGDVNAMIEAMTQGGTRRRGVVLAPRDAYDDDPVILRYVRSYPRATEVLEAGGRYALGDGD